MVSLPLRLQTSKKLKQHIQVLCKPLMHIYVANLKTKQNWKDAMKTVKHQQILVRVF